MGWKESIQTPTEKQDMKTWLCMVSAYFFWPFMMSCEQGWGWQWAHVGFLSFSQHQPLYQGSFGDRSTWHINTLSKWQWMLPSWGHLGLCTGGGWAISFWKNSHVSESAVTAPISHTILCELSSFPETPPPPQEMEYYITPLHMLSWPLVNFFPGDFGWFFFAFQSILSCRISHFQSCVFFF